MTVSRSAAKLSTVTGVIPLAQLALMDSCVLKKVNSTGGKIVALVDHTASREFRHCAQSAHSAF